MIGLADCNNFFVSCERSVNPALEGRAVVVLSNNDGCVVARSNEAKRMGIRMGKPAFRIRDMIERGDVVALSGNHLLYRSISLRVHDIFRRFAPDTMDYSVDEAFLDMDGIPGSALREIGEAIWQCCWEKEHIPVTIGFAPTKTLAKIATEVGKKSGLHVLVFPTAESSYDKCDELPISELWGMGRRLTRRMYMSGVYTIGDFIRRPVEWVRATMGVVGERSWRELHGESCIMLEHLDRTLQDTISETRTFPEDVDDYDYLRARVAIYCAHVSKRLRQMAGECREISVFLRTNRFHPERGISTPGATYVLDEPTADASRITAVAVRLLDNIFNPGMAYKRAGVVLSRITPSRPPEASLFDEGNRQLLQTIRSRKLMQAIDNLNVGAGPHRVKLASQLTKGHPGHNDGYSSSFGAPLPDGNPVFGK